jgi:hypothetical protein
LWVTLLVLLIAASGAGAYWWFQPDLPVPEWSTITSKWSAITSIVTEQASALKAKLRRPARAPTPVAPRPQAQPPPRPATQPVPAPAAARPAPSQPPRLAHLDLIGDSLVQVVRSFGERGTLFARGQLPCAGLARGLAGVEARWIAYNTARRKAGVLDAVHAARDQTLYASVDSVERRFEQSGCPRP